LSRSETPHEKLFQTSLCSIAIAAKLIVRRSTGAKNAFGQKYVLEAKAQKLITMIPRSSAGIEAEG
jgi:hypothetical protein